MMMAAVQLLMPTGPVLSNQRRLPSLMVAVDLSPALNTPG